MSGTLKDPLAWIRALFTYGYYCCRSVCKKFCGKHIPPHDISPGFPGPDLDFSLLNRLAVISAERYVHTASYAALPVMKFESE